jgi:cytochrome c
MSGFEINKILASIILAVLIIGGISFVGNLIVNIDHKKNQVTAYKIDIPESDITAQSAVSEEGEIIEPISTLLINASLEQGEKLYKKCGTCHNYKKNSTSKIGPNLWDIINRPKGKVEGFAYSNSLIKFGGKWTYEELAKFLYKPKNYINGTKMNFAGLKNVNDRANLISWLRQNSDNPVPLPE